MRQKKGHIGIEDFEMFRAEFGHRCMFKAMGFTSEELSLPRIAVVNSWSEQSPGHIHLRTIAEYIKAGIRMAGGMPFEINVIGPCTMLGKTIDDVARYDLPQREAILISIESALRVGWCHGWIGIGTCDKIIPGMILAAIRLNRPFILFPGGQMIPSSLEGRNIGYVEGQEIILKEFGKARSCKKAKESYLRRLEEITDYCGSSPGACGEMTTGNTLAILAEALGFSPPGTSTSLAVSAEKLRQAKEAGRMIVELVRKQVKPLEILTMASLKNAIAVDMAVCGGTNSVVHLQSYAYEAGLPLTLNVWEEIGQKIPVLCGITPSGPHVIYDFHRAGGVPAVMKRLEEFLDRRCITVVGKTVGEIIAGVERVDSDIIRPLDKPLLPFGALTILRGNLAPRGAVTRHTIVENKSLLQRTYKAKVFDSIEEAIEGILSGSKRLEPGDALVVRYIGPRGGPAMPCALSVVRALKIAGLRDVAIITDGRFSGFTKGYLAIGHVCPEAQVGGVIGLLRDGDLIEVNIPERRIEVKLTNEELAKRRGEWKPRDQSALKGVVALYAKLALQADEGAGWPVTWGDLSRV
ncbi:MAG: dihydroxy-acid dehydratase [Candidatus Methanomethyliaceae archaeon]